MLGIEIIIFNKSHNVQDAPYINCSGVLCFIFYTVFALSSLCPDLFRHSNAIVLTLPTAFSRVDCCTGSRLVAIGCSYSLSEL